MYQAKRMLVTGAAGFIGSHFVRLMLAKHRELEIISLDKLSYAGNVDNLAFARDKPRHHFVKGDINDANFITQLLGDYHIDTIAHFAAESHVDNSIENPKLFLETNILGTYTLLEAASHYWLEQNGWTEAECRFHHVSTDEVYGSLTLTEPGFSESHAYSPNSPYSASKAGSDHFVRAYHHTYGLPVTLSNCSNNYGPNQHFEKLIPTVIEACQNGRSIPVYGNGANIRDWLFVEDHCKAIERVIASGVVGEVYNVGGNNELDNLTLVKMICQLMDDLTPKDYPHRELISFVTDRAGHDFRYAVDSQKIKRELGWEAEGKFIDKLSTTVKHYLSKKSV